MACCNEPLSVSFAATAAVRANAAPITTAIENATTTLNTMQLPQLNPSAPNTNLARRHDDHVTLTSAQAGRGRPHNRPAAPAGASIASIHSDDQPHYGFLWKSCALVLGVTFACLEGP